MPEHNNPSLFYPPPLPLWVKIILGTAAALAVLGFAMLLAEAVRDFFG